MKNFSFRSEKMEEIIKKIVFNALDDAKMYLGNEEVDTFYQNWTVFYNLFLSQDLSLQEFRELANRYLLTLEESIIHLLDEYHEDPFKIKKMVILTQVLKEIKTVYGWF